MFDKFIGLLKYVHVNLPLIDVLQGIPKYVKYVKDMVVNKSILAEYATVDLTKECSSMILNRILTMLKDLGSFTVQIKLARVLRQEVLRFGRKYQFYAYFHVSKNGTRKAQVHNHYVAVSGTFGIKAR